MCAATRLSLGSGDCDPKSMPVTVAVNVIDVMASLIKNMAEPNDTLGIPALVAVKVVSRVQRVRQRERAKREVQLDLVALPLGEDA